MMRIRSVLIGSAIAVAFAAGLTAGRMAGAQTAPIKFTNVLQSDLQNLPGQETIVQVLDVAPGAVVPWHVHPDGHEIAYVIEGSAVLELEGQPAPHGQGRRRLAHPGQRAARRPQRQHDRAGAPRDRADQAQGQAGDGAGVKK